MHALTTDTPAEAWVHFNERRLPWSEGLTVADLLQAQGMAPEQVATALNGHFVARPARAQAALRPGDTLTTFQAIVGG